jgi:hypothetical protein
MVTQQIKSCPAIQPRALSITQGRAVGVAHYLLGGIATTWAFFLHVYCSRLIQQYLFFLPLVHPNRGWGIGILLFTRYMWSTYTPPSAFS